MTDRGPTTDDRQTVRGGAFPAPVAADVGIVAALSIEVGFLLDRLKRVRRYAGASHTVVEGELDDKVVAVIVGGPGQAAARAAADLLIQGHRPRWIVSPGFAGALDPALNRNDVVFPDVVLDTEGRRFAVDVKLSSMTSPSGAKLTTGTLLTVNEVVATVAAKAQLRATYGADVVDMETAAVAALCSERALRFLSIRVVSDDAGRDLPPEVADLLARTGGNRVGAALRSIWKRPSSLKDFLSLHLHAQEAADRLTEITLDAISRLPA